MSKLGFNIGVISHKHGDNVYLGYGLTDEEARSSMLKAAASFCCDYWVREGVPECLEEMTDDEEIVETYFQHVSHENLEEHVFSIPVGELARMTAILAGDEIRKHQERGDSYEKLYNDLSKRLSGIVGFCNRHMYGDKRYLRLTIEDLAQGNCVFVNGEVRSKDETSDVANSQARSTESGV